MATKDFAHLHVHTEYSMLDGAARLGDLFTHAKELGMKSMATSDHGFLFGAFDFWRQAKAHDIKPIIGVEAYLTPGTHRTDRSRVRWGDGSRDDVSGGGAYTHMTMWAETTEGMHNLFRASSIASLEGQLYKPRMDREVLQTYSKGLIATTGCPSGEIQTRLRLGQFDEALQAASDFRDIFGKDNFYCEVMDHGLDIERNVQEDLHRLAKQLNLPYVATNDLHYTRQEDHTAHAALLCVQSGSTLTDPKRFKFDADNFYLRSPEEMYSIFGDIPGACENTLEIAERCNVEFNTKANYMPNFPVPEGENEESWFVKEVEKGLHYRFPQGIPDRVRKQAEYEVGVITSMGFPGYFLVVADFINWAKRNGIRVGPGRGSGAGSMVAYAMRITELNPLDHDLIFERFLNPGRLGVALILFVVHVGQGDVLTHDVRRHRLGEALAHRVRLVHHAGGVLERLLRLNGAEGDDLRDLVLAVLIGHVVDDLAAATIVEVHIEVGHGDAVGVKESLENQVVVRVRARWWRTRCASPS